MKASIPALAGAILAVFSSRSFGQATIIDTTRSITASATNSTTRQLTANTTESTLASGRFSKTLSAVDWDVISDNSNDSTALNTSTSALQTSLACSLLFSGSGSVSASSSMKQLEGQLIASSDSYGQSSYSVDFAVANATMFSLTGNITGEASYHPGPLETIQASILLSSTSQSLPLYSVSEAPQGYSLYGISFNDPVDFTTLLEPGQTYTLSAMASAESRRIGQVGESIYAPGTAGFSFSASVPEPTGTLLIAAATALLKRRNNRPHSRSHFMG